MIRKYLFLVSERYAFPVMRPVQEEIIKRGDRVAWFFDKEDCAKYLRDDEDRLENLDDVLIYDPISVFGVSDFIYDFFPGTKIMLFHGFNVKPRSRKNVHFRHAWHCYDLLCTQGPDTTMGFTRIQEKYKSFEVAETGWPAFDALSKAAPQKNSRPKILYASTFSPSMTSTDKLFDEIKRLVKLDTWDWIITFHPLMASDIVKKYRSLTKYDNVEFLEEENNFLALTTADVMLCDTSSIIVEFLYLDKPVVTFKNRIPGPHLIDIDRPDSLQSALALALTKPKDLMTEITNFINHHNPYRDGGSSKRVMDAVERLNSGQVANLKSQPLNILRKMKSRVRFGYPMLDGLFRHRRV